MKWVVWSFRIILAAVFIYSGFVKILEPKAFIVDIENYRLLPYFFTALIAVILPWIEVFCGILMIWGKWIKGASLLIILLNLVFIVAISSALLRGLDINCGCFSLSDEMSKVSVIRIVEDMIFLIMAFLVFHKTVQKNNLP